MGFFSKQKKLEAVLSEKPEEQQQQQNGATPSSASSTPFDRETYLREVEQFEDVEVVVAGRAGVRIDRKSVSKKIKIIISNFESNYVCMFPCRSAPRSCTCTTSSGGPRTT